MRHINKIASRLRLLSCVKLVNCCSLIVDTPGLPTHFEGYEVKPELIDGSKLRFIGPDLHDKWKIYILKGDEWVRYMRPISSGMLEGFIKNHYEKIYRKEEDVMFDKEFAGVITKHDALMAQITSMNVKSIFTLTDLVEIMRKIGVIIDSHTVYNYLESLVQGNYGLRKMRPKGDSSCYYQVIKDIPLGVSTSQARDMMKKLAKSRGRLATIIVNYTPVRKVTYDNTKVQGAIKFYSSPLRPRRKQKGTKKTKARKRGHSLFDSMYYTLLGLDKGCAFTLEDLRSLLAGQQVHIRKPANRQYMDVLFKANCGIDKRKSSHSPGRIFYLISSYDLPPKTDDLTLSFFKELGKNSNREIEYVDYPIRTEMKFRAAPPGWTTEMKNRNYQLKEIWESICEPKAPGGDAKLEETVSSRLEEEELDSSFLDRQATDEDLGREAFAFMTSQMQRIEQLQARVEELKNVPDLKRELELKKSTIKELRQTVTDRFLRITDLEKEARQLRGETAKQSVRISELESELKKAKDSDTMTIAERMKALKDKYQKS